MTVGHRVVIWRFGDVTHELTRAEAEFLRDCLFAQRRPDWFRLGVMLRKALNGPEADLPLELSVFDVPALRAVLDGVRTGGSSGLVALQDDVGAKPHPDEASRALRERPDERAQEPGDGRGAGESGEQGSDAQLVVWRFGGATEGLNRPEAEILRDWLLAEPNLAWLALGGRLREALRDAEQAPVELTRSDVSVLQAVLHAAPLGDNPGLALLRRAAGS
jgi:hypothetical protein